MMPLIENGFVIAVVAKVVEDRQRRRNRLRHHAGRAVVGQAQPAA
ncbi:MAG TPA: hypothetical protein VNV86_15505 [Candidatus Acidoferrum sp.]|jgi:hypothetical protein|nr:hypothetical protein [Candidatus Acidoferrum sp.]